MKRVGRAPLRHRLFLGVVLLVLAASVWPGYLPAARVRPYVFGLPFALAWLVLCIGIVFLALLLTFRADMRSPSAKRRGHDD
ncbi:MAG TPA: hypothetical protein VKT74_04245 [Gammaproteobacteria bacterium]|nr:hypothetical protein [Gammaproteobacteria bacterium]